MLLIAAVAGIGVIAGRSTAPASVVAATRQAELDVGLDRIVPDFKFDAEPCGKVFDWLHEQTRANIAVSWAALSIVGAERGTPVTLTLKGVPLGRVLDLVCAQMGTGTEVKHHVDRGVIVVTTADEVSQAALVRIYDVRDVVKQYVDEGQRIAALEAPQPTSPAGGSRASIFGAAPLPPSGTHDEAITELTELIQETVSPESWREAGGSIGTVRVFSGRLIIQASLDMHLKIEELLLLIRSGAGEVRVP